MGRLKLTMFLEDKLLSFTHSQRVKISSLGHFFVLDRFGRSLQFCHLQPFKEVIYDG